MPQFRTIDDLAVLGKTVLVRGDLNVPVKKGVVGDTSRIDRLVPTLKEIAGRGAKVAILSHFGRPKGRDPALSLRVVLPALQAALGVPVDFAEDCIGPHAKLALSRAKPGGFVLLENVRFHPSEEANDRRFAEAMAELGDIYINDAFSASHRAHASVDELAELLPCAAGRLMQAELEALDRVLGAPERPVLALVGGAKISTKLDLLHNLVRKVDVLVLGGGMANTFLAASGTSIGASLHEPDMLDQARTIQAAAQKVGCAILLPADAVVAESLSEGVTSQVKPVSAVAPTELILDVGPVTVAEIGDRIDVAKTVLWNGPLGAFEVVPFDQGTVAAACRVADQTATRGLVSVAGGGDTVAALGKANVTNRFTYVSTAGGAFLEWLEGRDLPGVKALERGV